MNTYFCTLFLQVQMKRIFCIVQLPPPFHGASLMNNHLLNSPLLNAKYRLYTCNIATSSNIEDIGKFSLKKTAQSLVDFFKILVTIIRFRPDLVYFTLSPSGFAFYRDFVYSMLIKSFGKKLVFHLHGKGLSTGSANSSFFAGCCKMIFRGTYVIHLSEKLLNDTNHLTYKKGYIVNYGIPVIDLNKGEKSFDRTRLLFLSNYVKSKGIIDLIDAIEIVAKKNQNFHLNLVGKPYDVTVEWLQDYIGKKNISSFVTVCGPKYGDDKYRELANSDIFVFPTYYYNEAFPLALLEAMQFGLMVITTREGGISDMIEDGKTGLLIEKRDIMDLADKIQFSINNPERRRDIGLNAKSSFFEKYTLNVFEKNIEKTFDDILELKPE